MSNGLDIDHFIIRNVGYGVDQLLLHNVITDRALNGIGIGSFLTVGGMGFLGFFDHRAAAGNGADVPMVQRVSLPFRTFGMPLIAQIAPAIDIADLHGTVGVFKELAAAFALVVSFLAALGAGGPYLFHRLRITNVHSRPLCPIFLIAGLVCGNFRYSFTGKLGVVIPAFKCIAGFGDISG